MGRDVMDDRKRSLVLGKYKFLYQDDTEELESSDKFQLCVLNSKLQGPIQYHDKNGKDENILKIYGQTRPEGEGFSEPDVKIPGALDMFTVVWSNPFGEIFVDQDIKLFEFCDIQKYSTYNDGPKSKEFCQFHSSSSSKDLDGFDSSIFWSAGFLWRHFKTCGVEKWDIEFRELVTHYRNWKEWAHEVHNLPDSEKNKTGKFSTNRFSGPTSTSTHYTRSSRDKERSSLKRNTSLSPGPPPAKKEPTISLAPSTYTAPPPLPGPAKIGPPPVVAPPPGQAVTIPLAAPDGTITQVQVMTLPPTPITPGGEGAKFKYLNPHYPPPTYIPPPQQQTTSAAKLPGSPTSRLRIPGINRWTSAVDDFLSRPKRVVSSGGSSTSKVSRSPSRRHRSASPGGPRYASSPVKKKRTAETRARIVALKELKAKKQKGEENDDDGKKVSKKSKKFKPKSLVRAPTPTDEDEGDINDLDLLPENKIYSGIIKDWRGKFGFIESDSIPKKIFLHSKDIESGKENVGGGKIVTFKVLFQEKSAVGAKAVCAAIHD